MEESDIPLPDDVTVSVEQSQTVTFVDASPGDVMNLPSSVNAVALADGSQDISLGKFLARPFEIDQRSWATSDVSGILSTTLEPWFLYMNNAVVKNKLSNFAFIRAKLRVKTVVNGTPFHYGMLRVCYEPSVSNSAGFRTSKIRTSTIIPTATRIPYSQLPGYTINPGDNSGGEICIPMFLHKNWANLNSATDIKQLGRLTYYIFAPLNVVSTSASPTVTLTTYAWLEDVELMGSTANLILQGDEYSGKVSGPASSIARIASLFGSIPVIGPFARATAMGASSVAGIAHLFGYTNVPVITEVHAMVPSAGPHLATSEISVPIQKLSLDPKQEISIDPAMHNIGNKDELALVNVVTKESVLTVYNWSTTDTAGVVLFNSRVTPSLFIAAAVNNGSAVQVGNRVYHTPMSYTAMLFSHWKGDIIFSFNVVCSKFHKGRLRISWDPYGGNSTVVPDENTVYSTILDIGASNNAEFRVPYHQALAWLRTRGISQTNWTPGNTLAVDNDYDNGMISISVLNPLLSPVTPSSVYIVTSVRAADDFEFANPKSYLGESSVLPPPSIFALQGEEDSVEIKESSLPLGSISTKHDERYALNFGERILSLRTLMHRFSLVDISAPLGSSATQFGWFRKSFARLPPSYGYDPNGLSVASSVVTGVGTPNFNWVQTTPASYIAWMYGGYRGSMNYTINIGSDLYPSTTHVQVQRMSDSTYTSSRRGIIAASLNIGGLSSAVTKFMNQFTNNLGGGGAFTNTLTNGAIQFNFPDYASTNFAYPDATYSITGNLYDQTDRQCVLLETLIKQATANTTLVSTTVSSYAGTGPDFTCLWLLCCPTLDYALATPGTT